MLHPIRLSALTSLLTRAAALVVVAAIPIVLVTGAAASASPAIPGSAPAAPGVTPVNPGPAGYFTYTLSPGAGTSGSLIIHDLTPAAAAYDVYVANATTSPVSGVAYGQPGSLPPGVSWVHLSTAAVQVGADGTAPVGFTVAVPSGTPPGDYVVGLVTQTPQDATTPVQATGSTPGVTLRSSTRVVVAISVRVPGPATTAASFGPPTVSLQQHRRQVLTIPIDDTGSLLMKPYLSGTVRSCAGGRMVLSIARQLDTFVPHTSIDYPWYLNDQVLPAGCYRASLTLSATRGGAQLASYSGVVQVGAAAASVHPSTGQTLPSGTSLPSWLVPASAVGIVLLALTLLLLLRARRERQRLLLRLARSNATAPARQW